MILFERGRIVDEYLSVPEFYGPLPPGDVVGLAANPTVVARLTRRRSRRRSPRCADAPRPGRPPAGARAPRRARGRHARRGRRDRLGRRARPRGFRQDRALVKVLLLHGWPVSRADLGLAGLGAARGRLRSRGPAPLRRAGRRSTTGRRSSSATSTARSSPSARRWAATARSRSPAARPSGSWGWCSSARAPTRTRSSVAASASG